MASLSFPHPKKSPFKESSRMFPDIIVEDDHVMLFLQASVSHMEQHELDMDSPFAEVGGVWPRCWYFPAYAVLFTLFAVTKTGKRLD